MSGESKGFLHGESNLVLDATARPGELQQAAPLTFTAPLTALPRISCAVNRHEQVVSF